MWNVLAFYIHFTIISLRKWASNTVKPYKSQLKSFIKGMCLPRKLRNQQFIGFFSFSKTRTYVIYHIQLSNFRKSHSWKFLPGEPQPRKSVATMEKLFCTLKTRRNYEFFTITTKIFVIVWRLKNPQYKNTQLKSSKHPKEKMTEFLNTRSFKLLQGKYRIPFSLILERTKKSDNWPLGKTLVDLLE